MVYLEYLPAVGGINKYFSVFELSPSREYFNLSERVLPSFDSLSNRRRRLRISLRKRRIEARLIGFNNHHEGVDWKRYLEKEKRRRRLVRGKRIGRRNCFNKVNRRIKRLDLGL